MRVCLAHGYDEASNRTSENVTGSEAANRAIGYAYNAANQLTTKTGPGAAVANYTYDANGNQLTNGASRSLAYNLRDQMTKVTLSGTATTLGYLGAGQDSQVTDGAATLQNNAFGTGVRSVGSNSTYFTRDVNGQLLSQRAGSTREYALPDRLGSVTGLTSSSGALVRASRYEPYGITSSTTGTSTTPFGYAGGYAETGGMYHYGQRHYDSTDGRWTQQDPINQATDLREANRYAYVGADPINNADPSGTISSGLSASVCVGICVKASVSIGRRGASASVGSGVGLQAGIGGSVSTATPRKSRFTGTVTSTGCDGVCGSYDSRGNASIGGVGAGASLTGDVSTGIGY